MKHIQIFNIVGIIIPKPNTLLLFFLAQTNKQLSSIKSISDVKKIITIEGIADFIVDFNKMLTPSTLKKLNMVPQHIYDLEEDEFDGFDVRVHTKTIQ